MCAESPAVLRDSELKTAHPHSEAATFPDSKTVTLLFLLTAAAILVHGYHPFVEDAEIYMPGIKKLLNPALYPYNTEFFASHASKTLFPNLIAWSAWATHLPLEWGLLLWHFACIFALLVGCWKLGRICFGTTRAAWGSAVFVASMLTIPVAGTALYVMDQYLNPRSFSTAAAVWTLLAIFQRKFVFAALVCIVTALIHPLMAVFSLALALILLWREARASRANYASAFAIFPLALFPPVTSAYRQVLESHSYFFLLRWEWYEWLGIVGPLIILWLVGRMARRKHLLELEALCASAVIFGVLFFVVALAITIPPQFARLVELQPMRNLQLIYTLLLAISGGAFAEYLLKGKLWRWLILFVPLAGGMFYAQRQLFPATAHLELPGRNPANQWVQTFIWIKDNTPLNAYFALDPDHMRLAGEDQHGFRAIAERSMLADRVKDSGAVSMFSALTQTWLQQVTDENGWSRFGVEDFRRLQGKYGIDWVVVRRGVPGLNCPFKNSALAVCHIGQPTSEHGNTVK